MRPTTDSRVAKARNACVLSEAAKSLLKPLALLGVAPVRRPPEPQEQDRRIEPHELSKNRSSYLLLCDRLLQHLGGWASPSALFSFGWIR